MKMRMQAPPALRAGLFFCVSAGGVFVAGPSVVRGEESRLATQTRKAFERFEFEREGSRRFLFVSPENGDLELAAEGYRIGDGRGTQFFFERHRNDAVIRSVRRTVRVDGWAKGGQAFLPERVLRLEGHRLGVGYRESRFFHTRFDSALGVVGGKTFGFWIRDEYEKGPGSRWWLSYGREGLVQDVTGNQFQTRAWSLGRGRGRPDGPFEWSLETARLSPSRLKENYRFRGRVEHTFFRALTASVEAGAYANGLPTMADGYADVSGQLMFLYLNDPQERKKIAPLYEKAFGYYELRIGAKWAF